jgi:hypothetical protein
MHYRLGPQDSYARKTLLKAGQRFHRLLYEWPYHNMEILADHFGKDTVCDFVRFTVKRERYFRFILPDEYDIRMTKGDGWFFRCRNLGKHHYWIPLQPVVRNYDKFGRILSEETLPLIKMDVLRHYSCALFEIPEGHDFVEFVVWSLPSDSSLLEELYSLSPQERQNIFLWGSHTKYSGPKDVYRNLIWGAVYKSAWRWPPRSWKTVYCEADAHALYVALHSLWIATGKKIYQHLKTQLVFSVAVRQETNGAWHHGEWTDEFEVQYRLHCSGIHLLAADYEETKDDLVKSYLRKAVEYMKTQCDELTVGTWYLHDSLESSVAALRKGPLSFQNSRALGKSPSNMLVLNTHLDALVALHRYEEVTGRRFQGKEINEGVDATLAVLGLKPAEIFYRLYFKAIDLTFLPNSEARKLPLHLRAVRRLAREKLIPLLPRVKKLIPRLGMPNGYIDRGLSLDEFTYNYFPINVMDLLRFQRRFRVKTLDPIIVSAVDCMLRISLERWLEDASAAYALGFWAEAMYVYCLSRAGESRSALAEVVIALLTSKKGLPPSLLGCNSEFVPLTNQVPCLWTDNDRIRIVNLSVGPAQLEFLLVNITDMPQEVTVPSEWETWDMLDQQDQEISAGKTLMVPACGWVRLLSSLRDEIR